jgi:phospholipid/cholesterol/gamma-HCH transport system substrate-binding protein
METRARYVLIGLFTLAVILIGFGFVYWMENAGGLRERTLYRVRFENSVSGLIKGSAVLFNGMRVGEVVGLSLQPSDPNQVLATISVDPGTPVHSDTKLTLEFGGLLGGTPAVSLTGGTASSPLIRGNPRDPPVLVADAAGSQTMSQQARDVLRRVDTILAENSDALHGALKNLNTFSDVLARNSDRFDTILAGLNRLAGGGSDNKAVPVFDLSPVRNFPGTVKPIKAQMVVPEPTALVMFQTQKVLLTADGETSALENAQWSDALPKMIQEKIVQSFENASDLRTVSLPADGLNADYQLLIDLHSFQLVSEGAPIAQVEFSAKILAQDGRIVNARIFRASAPGKGTDALQATAALNEAFGKAAAELVTWASGAI